MTTTTGREPVTGPADDDGDADALVVRRSVTRASMILSLATMVLVAIGVGGIAPALVVVCFTLLAPGWTLVSHWHLGDLAIEGLLAVAVSISLATATAMGMVWAHWFHPRAATLAVAGACAVTIAVRWRAERGAS